MRALAFATLLALAACAGTPPGTGSYDALDNETAFRSADIPLGKSASSSYGANTAFALRAVASCVGKGCEPEAFVLALINKTPNETALDDETQVVFSTADGSITIDPSNGGNNSVLAEMASGRGEIVRVSVPRDIFTSFATAGSLDIRFGGSLYSLPYSSRSSFRRMLQPVL